MNKKVINLAHIQSIGNIPHILLVRKNETWILPGGKKEEGESEKECLRREIAEEIPSSTQAVIRKYWKTFEGITPHSKKEIEAAVYFGEIAPPYNPAQEISEVRFMSRSILKDANLSVITQDIITTLQKEKLL